MIKFTRSTFPKIWATALVGSAAFMLVGSASAQFSTNFDNYIPNNSLSPQNGWATNDPDAGSTYTFGGGQTGSIGATDDVSFINGFSTSTSDFAASFGGQFAPGNVSGVPSVTLSHGLALGGATPSVSVALDFGVTQSTGSFASRDSFGFALTGPTGATLFSLNFVPSASTTNFDNVTFTTATGTTPSGDGFFLGTRLHLTLNVNETASTFSAILGGVQIVTNAPFTGGAVAGFSAIWNLADTASTTPGSVAGTTAYTDPGSNILAFDNIVTSVPEPSTYALLGAGVLCLAAVIRRRVA